MAKIMVVDDAAFMRMMLKDILTKGGYEVVGEAENGLKAVDKYKELSPDLVLKDITMPELDGIGAVRQIKGIDPNAKTPAYTKEDGEDFIPTPKAVVFSHQFSSIAGAGPVTGPIIAAMFGWVPVLLWLLIGGIFFGAVHDFAALYASVKNEGKSIGGLIEQYIGKTGRKFFFLFAWIFTLLVIAAFSDIVASTFNGIAGLTMGRKVVLLEGGEEKEPFKIHQSILFFSKGLLRKNI